MRLENWSTCLRLSPNSPPEGIRSCLQGNVFGHPRFPEGEFVTTSAIIGTRKECILTVSGSVYELGKPDKEYEKEFPLCKRRLLNYLRSVVEEDE